VILLDFPEGKSLEGLLWVSVFLSLKVVAAGLLGGVCWVRKGDAG